MPKKKYQTVRHAIQVNEKISNQTRNEERSNPKPTNFFNNNTNTSQKNISVPSNSEQPRIEQKPEINQHDILLSCYS